MGDGIVAGQRNESYAPVGKSRRREVEHHVEVTATAQVNAPVVVLYHLVLAVHVGQCGTSCRKRVGGGHFVDVHHQLRVAFIQCHITVT